MTLTEQIRKTRLSKNITQSVIARHLNTTVQNYSMKETGKRPITTTELEVIASVLNVPVSIFFEN